MNIRESENYFSSDYFAIMLAKTIFFIAAILGMFGGLVCGSDLKNIILEHITLFKTLDDVIMSGKYCLTFSFLFMLFAHSMGQFFHMLYERRLELKLEEINNTSKDN